MNKSNTKVSVINMERTLQKILETSRTMKHELNQNSTILDFGCGNGELVYKLRECGFPAFGCDFEFKLGDTFLITRLDYGGRVTTLNNPIASEVLQSRAKEFSQEKSVTEYLKLIGFNRR